MNIIKTIKSVMYLSKSKHAITIPIDELLASAKRCMMSYKDPNELLDIIDDKMPHKISEFIKEELKDISPRFITDNTNTDAQAYVYSKKNKGKNVHIVFRGTSSYKDVIHDVQLSSILYGTKKERSIRIHSGFMCQYNSIKNAIYDFIRNELGDTVYVSGHSLGGALAQIAAVDISERFGCKVVCHTFGSPRVGDSDFVEWFDNNVKESYRVINVKDIVPNIPMRPLWHHSMRNAISLSKDGYVKKLTYDISPLKRLYIFFKTFNIIKPKNDHSCGIYIDRLELIASCNL
uniref:Fungal lipase-type domain-containing protein n=1 Tax=viral metagenome TaxID=1070528 RepID=A0A6C0DZ54_9ZZZZ